MCYNGEDEDWCFHDNYPYDNMPLPEGPGDVEPSMTLFTDENPSDGDSIIEWKGGQFTINLRYATWFYISGTQAYH